MKVWPAIVIYCLLLKYGVLINFEEFFIVQHLSSDLESQMISLEFQIYPGNLAVQVRTKLRRVVYYKLEVVMLVVGIGEAQVC